MKRHLILFFSALAGIAAAQNVMHNMVSRHTPVNTNLIGAVVGEGLTLTNGVLSSTGGGASGGTDGQAVTNIVEGIVSSATNGLVRKSGDTMHGPLKFMDGTPEDPSSAFPVVVSGSADGQGTGGLKWDAWQYSGFFAPVAGYYWVWFMNGRWFHLPIEKGGVTQVGAAEIAVLSDLDNYLLKSERDLHWDSATNIVWKNVYSNGWVYLMPFARTEEVTQ